RRLAPTSTSATATRWAAARCTIPAMISTTPRCRLVRRCLPNSCNRSCHGALRIRRYFMSAIDAIREYAEELTAIRRDLHTNPELGLEEHRTAEIVAKKLAEWGIEVHRGVGKTGVVGVLRRGSGGRAVGLRADMDCLPMEEQTNLPYSSRNAGRMH